MCYHFQKASVGGRPKKLRIGRPSSNSNRSAMVHIASIAPRSFFHSTDYRSQVLQSPSSAVSVEDLVCQLCRSIVDRPIQLTTCNKLVCMNCLCTRLKQGEYCCPCCSQDHIKDHTTMVQPSPVVMKILGELKVTCDKCQQQIEAGIVGYG